MSIVAVHGPNTFGVGGAGGGGTSGTVTNAGGTVTADISNGMKFTFAGAGNRAPADYDWAFTGGAGAAAQADTKNGTVTFTDAGAKVITLTLGSSGGTTPAPGTYTFNVVTKAGPRSGEEPAAEAADKPEAGDVDVDVGYDPGAHSVADVIEFVESHMDKAYDVLTTEMEGKNRSTLVSHLEGILGTE